MTLNKLASALISAAAIVVPVAAHADAEQVDASLNAKAEHRAGELLVKFRANLESSARGAALQVAGARSVQVLRAGRAGEGELHRVSLAKGASLSAAIKLLRAQAAVEFAEPNWVYKAQAVPEDLYYVNGSQWGVEGATSPLVTNEFGSGAAVAWNNDHTCDKKMVVGIIDTGVFWDTKELNKNVWVNGLDLGADEDGNGYVGDIHGWDFVNGDGTVFDDLNDTHGTQVAGIIAAKSNGGGIAGVCWGAKFVVAKTMTSGAGDAAKAVMALDYLIDLKASQGVGIAVVNASWGGAGYSDALKAAIQRAADANILFVTAAGNGSNNIDKVPFYPASYKLDNMITVAGITSTGSLGGYSNFGPGTVHIAAPGSGIFTTTVVLKPAGYKPGLVSVSGTSWAASFVTGAAAMYASSHLNAPYAEIKAAILNAAIPTASVSSKVSTGGRLDMSGF